MGKCTAHSPYEFGVKVSVATTNRRCKGGQVVLQAEILPGNPYDGATLAAVTEETEPPTGREMDRASIDKGYRDHHAPKTLRVFRPGQKRCVHGAVKRELRHRSTSKILIGHVKTDGHLGGNVLKGRNGDHANAVLTAASYNFRPVLKWLRTLLRQILLALFADLRSQSTLIRLVIGQPKTH